MTTENKNVKRIVAPDFATLSSSFDAKDVWIESSR